MIVVALVILLQFGGGCDLPLPSDLNRDCEINMEDLFIMADQWLKESGVAHTGSVALNDTVDFTTLLQQWGHTGGRNCSECEDWKTKHPEWIFCDDFDVSTPLRREGRYFEYDDDEGDFTVVEGVVIFQLVNLVLILFDIDYISCNFTNICLILAQNRRIWPEKITSYHK